LGCKEKLSFLEKLSFYVPIRSQPGGGRFPLQGAQGEEQSGEMMRCQASSSEMGMVLRAPTW